LERTARTEFVEFSANAEGTENFEGSEDGVQDSELGVREGKEKRI